MKPERIIAVRNNKTVFRDGKNCIKVFGSDYSNADILNEALNLARIEETGLCVPQLREVTLTEEGRCIVSDFIKGKTFSELIKSEPAKKAEYIAAMVDLQLEIHSKSCPLLGRLYDKIKRKI